jgi:hypothetical protein
MRPFSLPSKPVDFSVDGFGEDGDVDVEEVGEVVVLVVGVVEVVGMRLCVVDVFTVTVDGVDVLFDGAVEIPYTMTASALRSVTVVVCAERVPSSRSTYPGSGSVTTAPLPFP